MQASLNLEKIRKLEQVWLVNTRDCFGFDSQVNGINLDCIE